MNITGEMINKYQILEQLGEGSTSFVYKALDSENNQTIIIKLMKAELISNYIDDLIRFKREIEITGGLDHPNIVKIFGSGEYQNIPYIVMEFIPGQSLADFLKSGGKFTTETVVQLVSQLAETLHYIHHHGVIHRDLKPGNIYLNMETAKPNIKLLDFGVSHIIELGAIRDPKLVTGTFGYMSPETTGILNRKVDERSDLYSLGVIFYQLLTGSLPFQGQEVKQILHQQAALVPTRPETLNPEIPPIISAINMKLLQKDPDKRYQSASGLLCDLNHYIQGQTQFIIGGNDQPQKITFQPTRLFGRSVEIDQIYTLLTQAGTGQGTFCIITGEAGIGKSRLVEEIHADLYTQNELFIRGRCLDHVNKTPYQPFRDAIDEYLKWFEKLSPETMEPERDRLRNVLGDLGQIALQLNPRLEKVIGQTKPLVSLEPERENQRFLMVLANFFCQLPRPGKPGILFLDDLQWADEGTLNLLEEITGQIDECNLLILGTYRDSDPGSKSNLERLNTRSREKNFNLKEIKLCLLDSGQLNHLVANILNATEAPSPDLIRYLLEKSKGNPFFAIHIIRAMVEKQALRRLENHWEINWERLYGLSIPDNIVAIILRQNEHLTPKQVDILCNAAVIGREFNIEILFQLLPLDKRDFVNTVDEMISLQLLSKLAERGRFLFTHDRIRDAFYQRLSEPQKREIHRKVAQAIEDINSQDLEQVLFELAHHYIEAGDQPKALKYVLPAANKAKASYANEQAIQYYQKALQLLENTGYKGSNDWIKANEELAEVYLTIGKNDEAIAICENLLPLVAIPMSQAKIHKKAGMAWFKKGDWSKSENHFRKGLALLNYKLPDSRMAVMASLAGELIAYLLHHLFPVLFFHPAGKPVRETDREIVNSCIFLTWLYGLSDILKHIHITFKILNLSESKIGKSKELGIALCHYAAIFMVISFFKTSIKIQKKALMIREKLGDDWGFAQSLQFMGHVYNWKGDQQNSIDYFERSQIKFQKIGDLWEQGMSTMQSGLSCQRSADYQKGIAYLQKYLEISRQLKDAFGIGIAQINMAFIYIETGDFVIAETMIKNCLEICAGHTLLLLQCITLACYGEVELEKASYDQAIYYLKQAREIDQKNNFLRENVVYLYPFLADAYLKKLKEQAKTGISINYKQSFVLCKDALKITKAWPNHYGTAMRVMAGYHALRNNRRKAEKYYRNSIAHYEKLKRKYEAAKCYLEYGNFLNSILRRDEANFNWHQAYHIFKSIGANAHMKICEDLINLTTGKAVGDESTITNRLTSERRKNAMITTGRYISSILNIDRLLEKVLDCAMELVGAERGVLLLYPETGVRKLEPKIIRNIAADEINSLGLNISNHIIAKVEKNRCSFVMMDAMADETLKTYSSIVISGIHSVICTPIMLKGEMLGIIYLDNSLISGLFTDEDLELLGLIANQAGVSIENARLCQSLEQRVIERTEQLEATNRELNQANQKLYEMDQIKSKFFANVSHEFRTPLTLILSPLETIIQGDYGKTIDSNHAVLQSIHHNTLRLLKLINNLLDFSKLEAGKMTVCYRKLNISKMIEFYVANVHSVAENKGLQFLCQDDTHGLITYIDPDLFEKVVFNLISNALKFTPPGGVITIQLNKIDNCAKNLPAHGATGDTNRSESGNFQITVADTGVGIPEDKLTRIFERFSQLDNWSTRRYAGTGIGLALAKEIVELQGGKIEVKSKVNEGSIFTITLPIKNEPLSEHEVDLDSITDPKPYILSDINYEQTDSVPPNTNPKPLSDKLFRILIVEDNPGMIAFLTSILTKEYDIVTAANGLEGIQKATVFLPDLILADVMMPEMDGYEMTARLRQNDIFQGIPIILLTAKAEIPMKIEGLELGATDYIAKPFIARELMARIKSQLEMKRLRDEIASQKETLAKSEVRFREMADFLPSAIIETNKDFEITYLNQAAIKILGITQPDFTKAVCLKEFIHYEDQQRFGSEMSNILHQGTPGVYEYKFQSQDGQDFLVLLKATLLIDQNNIRLRMAMIEINTFFNLVALPDEVFYKKYHITDKEKSILMEVLMGRRNKEIGEKFFISEIAVKKHISNLFQKTGVNNRSELFKLIQGEKNHPATSRPPDD